MTLTNDVSLSGLVDQILMASEALIEMGHLTGSVRSARTGWQLNGQVAYVVQRTEFESCSKVRKDTFLVTGNKSGSRCTESVIIGPISIGPPFWFQFTIQHR